LDRGQVINTNAEAAALLRRVGAAVGDGGLRDFSDSILRFVLENQNADGSWYYYAEDSHGGPSLIDGYHTGMVLNALLDVSTNAKPEDGVAEIARKALENGLDYYLRHLFGPDGRPLCVAGKDFPMDIYACGQAVWSLSEAGRFAGLPEELAGRARTRARQAADFSVDGMMDRDGSFIYRRYRFGAIRLRSLRWAQGLMCLALARHLTPAGSADRA
ncbi:MAG: hypothetical protein K8I02_01545, partial [Candidatus Methylomirabilis sp.]|nr:hypothetical protein [Deltaproteobacteria bacterium]